MIREYQNQDLDDLLDVWYRASLVAHPFFDDAFLNQERRSIAEIHLPAAETYVYLEDGRVVGFIALMGSEVGAIFVHPSLHGRGIGRALMDHARALCGELELDVFADNKIGRRFYNRYGFTQVGEEIHEPTGRRLLRMRLSGESD